MTKQLYRQFDLIATTMDLKFSLRDKPIAYEQVFSSNGMLPGIIRRADQLCSLCLGYGLGVTFNEAENATLGLKVTFDDITPDILRYLCVIDVLLELAKSAPADGVIPLDELLYD